jgi:hypothetical protein
VGGGGLSASCVSTPLPVLRWLRGAGAAAVEELVDDAWMVRSTGRGGEEAVAKLVAASKEGQFVVFGVDGF